MYKTELLCCLLTVMSITGCAVPKRGDPEFAPAMPRQIQLSDQHVDAIYQPGTSLLLFEDIKARRVGDMITVVLQEQTDAEKSADTGTAKSTSTEIANPIIFGNSPTHNGDPIFRNSLQSDHEFDGSADSSQSNSLTGSITVTVVDVLTNGNLVVQGEKWININQGEEYIRLKGIVRPRDIRSDNTIASTRVADAQIQYSGEGVLNETNNMGWLARFLNGPWMPF
ncbi:MAG: flagellar basal body L-ring protein FlgH [Gammaproteobacteria bacterium]|jgi:flagellar L-ring protein precursor FlgH